jgi:hypothetical protein
MLKIYWLHVFQHNKTGYTIQLKIHLFPQVCICKINSMYKLLNHSAIVDKKTEVHL